MFLFGSAFFFLFGIGTLLAILWVTIRYVIPSIFLFIKGVGEVFAVWGKAANEGWKEGGERLNASGKPRR